MRENFALAVGFVLKHEGGYSNDPSDPGGETNFGISKRYHPNVDIKNLDARGAAEIYLNEYWLPEGDTLPFPLDIAFMDAAVNMGKGVSNSFIVQGTTWEEMLFRRVRYYTEKVIANPIKLKYFFGWTNRVIELRSLIKDEQKRRNK